MDYYFFDDSAVPAFCSLRLVRVSFSWLFFHTTRKIVPAIAESESVSFDFDNGDDSWHKLCKTFLCLVLAHARECHPVPMAIGIMSASLNRIGDDEKSLLRAVTKGFGRRRPAGQDWMS
jgi:hypothetical protein